MRESSMLKIILKIILFCSLLVNVSCISGVYSIYPIVYSDGYASSIAIYTPDTYVAGNAVKWVVYVHGLGASSVRRINYPQYRTQADEHGIVLVGIDSVPREPYFDTNLFPRHHLEEGIALAKLKLNLSDYLPCLYGVSMGGRKVIHEMVYHAENYSCFAISSAVTDMIQWELDHTGLFDISWNSLMGGPTSSIDIIVHDQWVSDAPGTLIGSANLQGRKLYAVHGTGDTAVPYSTQFIPLINAIPAANLAAAISPVNAIHQDFMLDNAYNTGYFDFFMKNSMFVTTPADRN
jgi:hypothetical protein